MSFFERQASARRSSRQLILLFALAVLAIVLAVALVVVSSVLLLDDEARLAASSLPELLRAQLPLLWMVSVLTLGLILIASWKRGYELSQGGSLIARQLGGREIGSGCNDPNDRRLRNIVEELAIAACLPVPAVFVLDKEPGINAFAAGHTPSDAAIAVTRGALERLNRDELQGVIAHEFSHVLNGDMRLNIRLVGVLYGIVVLGVIGRYLLRYGRSSRDSRGTAVVLLAAALVVAIGAIGVFFGRLIKASVSRSREALADASALQFTRQSAGLAGALKKIAALSEGAALQHPKAEEVSHMLFGESRAYSRWFATHPPLLERIQALDPSFSAAQLEALRRDWKQAPPSGMAEDTTLGLVGSSLMQGALRLPDPSAELRPQPGATSARIAQPQSDDARRASSLHQLVPERLGAAARSPDAASALVLAMLVDRDRAVQARQLAEVAVELNEDIADAVAELVAECRSLHAALRLPTVALAFPALRRKPRSELQRLVKCCDRLVHLDGRVSLFDYCLSRMLQSQVIETWEPQHYRAAGTRKLFECTDALADLFSTLVSYGHDDPDAMRRAFVAGLVIVLPQHRFHFAPPPNWVAALDRALAQLDGLDAAGKQLLVEGLVNAVAHDGRITVHEAELIRTICSCLHCPLPPIVEQRARSRS